MRTRVGVLALMALLSAACGKIKGGASDAAPEPDANQADAAPPDPCAAGSNPSFDEALACIEVAACDLFSRCFAPFEEGQCGNVRFSFFGRNSSFNEHAIAEAIEAGLIDYDPSAIAACVALFHDTTCQEFNSIGGEFLDLCPFLSGTVADGDDCVVAAECATPHAACSEPAECAPEDVCCVRGCVPPSPVDGECDEFGDTLFCAPGDHCVDNGDIDYCRTGEDGAQCSSSSDCDPGLWCQDGSCRPEVASQAACFDDDQCSGPETCLGNNLVGGEVVAACGRSDREGDPCDQSGCSGFYCDQPSASELGTCIPYLREEGADCSVKDCALPGWVCDPAADQCVPRVGIGEVCSDLATQRCQFGQFCTNDITDEAEGVCATRLADGERCDSSDQCDSGICGGEAPTTCQPYPGCF